VAKSSNFIGEVLHFNAVRLRVTGSGNLQLFLRSLDDTNNIQLSSVPMLSTTNIEPTVLANFIDQRGQLEIRTTEIDEVFTVSKIIIFIKPIASGYPM
jgi:hypothetical protein